MRFSLARALAIASKENLHLRRDRLTGGMIAGIPIVMTVLFGYAINSDVRGLTAAVVDESNTVASRELIAATKASQVLDKLIVADSPWQLQQMLIEGQISVGIHIPPEFRETIDPCSSSLCATVGR